MLDEALPAEVILAEDAGENRAAAVNQKNRSTRTLPDHRRKTPNPLEIERCEDDRIDRLVFAESRIGSDDGRLAIGPGHDIVAQHESPAAARVLDERTIGDVQTNRS